MPDVNSPDFWEKFYQKGQAFWDLGQPAPVFRRLIESGQFTPGRMIVLGAGRGHDARLFAQNGFAVSAVDFSSEAVSEMRKMADPQAPVEVIQADLFELSYTYNGSFDYVLEYTFFPAIDPQRRQDYVELVRRLLKPGGTLIALLFPVSQHTGGPPYAVSPDDYLRSFTERGFELLQRETPRDSVPQRQGLEELQILRLPAPSG